MKIVLLLSLLLLSIGLYSYVCWEEDGRAIRQETNLNYSSAVINLSGGGYMLMWSDSSDGLQEMKVQKVSEAGESVWAEPISLSERALYFPNGEIILQASDGNIITAWYELDNPTLIRCQKLDQDGNRLWGDDGLTFEMDFDTDDCFLLETVEDLNGGVYIIYNKNSVRAIHLDSDGNVSENWGSTGNVIFTDIVYSDLEVISDGYGGFVVSARENNSSTFLMQRFNIEAENLWEDEGLFITGTYDLQISNWETGMYAIIYRDREEEVFKTTLLSSDGDFLLEEPQTIGLQMQGGYIYDWDFTRSSDGKLIIVFSDNNYGSEVYVLVAQKLEIGEEPDWGENGIIIHINNFFNCSYTIEEISADESGGVFLCSEYWDEDVNGIMYDHLDCDGSPVSDELITEMSSHEHPSPVFLENSNNNCGIFWDIKEGGFQRIKMQIMDENDDLVFAAGGNTVYEVIAGNVGTAYLATSGTNTAMTWEESRYDEYTTFIQLLDNETGEVLFEDQGLAVNELYDIDQCYPKVAFSESGELICVCYHCTDYDVQTGGAQIIDLSGNLLVGENGLQFGALPVVFDQISLGRSGNDFLIAWSERSNDFIHPETFLKVQRINGNGALWGEGITLRSGIDNECIGITIEDNYIFWQEGDFSENPDLYVIRLDENGEPAPGWDMEGICLAQVINNPNYYYEFPYNENILVLWYQSSANHTYLYAQLVSEEGDLLWGDNGVEIGCDIYIKRIELFGEYLYISTWDNGPDNMEINKYDLEGNMVWSSPVVITSFPYSPRFDLKINDDVIVAYWTDNNYNIKALLYDLDGNLIENVPPDGIDICSAIHSQYLFTSIIDENDNSIVVWGDSRGEFMPASDPSIYVQKIDLSTVPVAEDDIPGGNLLNVSNYPNPFTRSTTLKCDLPRSAEDAEIVIYNIKGQKVRSLPATSNEVQWDCRNQAGNIAGSGVYFYVLQGKNIKSETGKMIMLR